MTIYGQKITYNRDLDQYAVVSATPNYLSDLSFFSNQINSSKISLMSEKLNSLEKIINGD